MDCIDSTQFNPFQFIINGKRIYFFFPFFLLYVMTKQQPQTRVFDPTGHETFVTRQSDILDHNFPLLSIFMTRIIANN